MGEGRVGEQGMQVSADGRQPALIREAYVRMFLCYYIHPERGIDTGLRSPVYLGVMLLFLSEVMR